MSGLHHESKIKTKISMGVKVVRGESGEHGPPGSTEDLGVQSQQTVEIDYPTAVKMFGQKEADNIFLKSGDTDE